jgi:hypothetical protein
VEASGAVVEAVDMFLLNGVLAKGIVLNLRTLLNIPNLNKKHHARDFYSFLTFHPLEICTGTWLTRLLSFPLL